MAIVTITRHYSDFSNVADKLSVGNNEHDGDASAADYSLPEGYAVDAAYNVIRDRDGYECAIVLHDSNPKLISRGGKITAEPVLMEV